MIPLQECLLVVLPASTIYTFPPADCYALPNEVDWSAGDFIVMGSFGFGFLELSWNLRG
jgi:hypothetical protein